MKRLKRLYSALGLVVAAALAAGLYAGRGASAVAQEAGAAEEEQSVLVTTVEAQSHMLPLTIDVFGLVATGMPQTLSFPQAGQLLRLAVVPGQRVRRGDLIATLGSDPGARSAYAQAESGLAFARRELQRNRDLLGLQLATQAQVDTAARQMADAQSALDTQAKLGGASAEARLSAPFDAVIAAVPVAQGDRLAAGAAVVQLGPVDRLRVLLAIEPAASAALRVGMPVSLRAVQGEQTVRAAIGALQNVVDPKTQMTGAIVPLPAGLPDGLLPGMQVTGTIELDRKQAWVVPRQAVLSDDKGTYLFQVLKGRARRVAVARLVDAGATFGVSGPLDPALPVVVLGNYELQDKMAVRTAAGAAGGTVR
jgi:RND family efflux transporter MFP subunit